MASERRSEHPFYMYDAIVDQPSAFARAATRQEEEVDRLASRLATCDRLYLVGIGTSYHAAQVGEHLVRAYGAGLPVQAIHSFDFALYGPGLGPWDAVVAISHRGTKRYTLESLGRARDSGCPTAMITGEGGGTGPTPDALVLRTCPQEKSSAHTVSYTAAIAVLAALVGRLGHHRGGAMSPDGRLLLDDLQSALQESLATEGAMAALALEHRARRRVWLVGGGPGAVTAREVALKIRETSYAQAEGMAVEAMLHGPFQCAEADDLFVLIAPSGPSQPRVLELAAMVEAIGAPYLVISDASAPASRPGASGWIDVPAVPEPFSALTCLLPLQFFAYHLALARGTDPDGFRLDDPRFAAARRLVTL